MFCVPDKSKGGVICMRTLSWSTRSFVGRKVSLPLVELTEDSGEKKYCDRTHVRTCDRH
jgi:hypothetical protein